LFIVNRLLLQRFPLLPDTANFNFYLLPSAFCLLLTSSLDVVGQLMRVLVLNAGSSSQKTRFYYLPDDRLPTEPIPSLWDGDISWFDGRGIAEFQIKTAAGEVTRIAQPSRSRSEDTQQLLNYLWAGNTAVISSPQEIDIVGHRVVHGGEEYRESTIVTPTVKDVIERLTKFAPLHNLANLAGIDAIDRLIDVPQVAVFDTAFHAHLPPAAAIYPGSYDWVSQGIRKYGFHGISHQYCAHQAAEILQRDLSSLRLINCHLGNGCSLVAIREGRSVDTTMGFTPLDGLMMGTRSGAVDPGILIHLLRQRDYTVDRLDDLLNHRSGLLGISGVSNDLREIVTAIADGNDRAQLALDIYIHRLRSGIGSMLASLGGLDALIFTAGVGENSPSIRSRVVESFKFLGIEIDEQINQNSPRDRDISTPNSAVRVLVIHTQEDWAIAQECWRLKVKNQT
jgi:acetate kinase